MTKPLGYIFYDGRSSIDGSPILGIAISVHGKNGNTKTGDMVQTYIIRKDISPMMAVRAGLDVSVCGLCIHRGNGIDGSGRSCYVLIGQGPTQVYKSYRRGRYKRISPSRLARLVRGKSVRLGAYGDPMAIPSKVWKSLLSLSGGHTGYTHQWRESRGRLYRSFLMASCDTLAESALAIRQNWRQYLVRPRGAPIPDGLFDCPSPRLSCDQCLACNGNPNDRGSSPSIEAHGGIAVSSNYTLRILPDYN